MEMKRKNVSSTTDLDIESSSLRLQSSATSSVAVTRAKLSSTACSSLLEVCDLTKSRAFQSLASRAFDVCDDSGDGIVDEAELYAGLLLVHLNLAKYAGPSACYPPTRAVCDRLFLKADRDRSGGIDRAEFQYIMGILCAQILSRMLVYYLVLILGVPLLATVVVQAMGIPKEQAYLELATRESVSCAVFFLAIPLLWNAIDARYSGGGRFVNSVLDDDDMHPTNSMEGSVSLLPSRREEQRQRRRQRKSLKLQLQNT